jgi:hypothetical protein
MAMLLRYLGPYEIIFMTMCVVITVAMVILLRDFGPWDNIYDDVCLLL